MPVLPLRIYGDPVLRARAQPLLEVTDTVKPFVLDMFDTMFAEDGVGLAAPQVGASQRLLVLAVPVKRRQRVDMTLINPEVVRAEGWEVGEEGCLSVPGVYDEVKRASSIDVEALDESGRPVKFSADGFLARAIQHEIDHLNGVLFVDRLGMLQRRIHKSELKAIEEGREGKGGKRHEGPAL
jgi:peptide deformylase